MAGHLEEIDSAIENNLGPGGGPGGHPYNYCGDTLFLVKFDGVKFILIPFAILGDTHG